MGTDAVMPAPPPGFVPERSAAPAPPPGFVPEASAAPTPPPGFVPEAHASAAPAPPPGFVPETPIHGLAGYTVQAPKAGPPTQLQALGAQSLPSTPAPLPPNDLQLAATGIGAQVRRLAASSREQSVREAIQSHQSDTPVGTVKQIVAEPENTTAVRDAAAQQQQQAFGKIQNPAVKWTAENALPIGGPMLAQAAGPLASATVAGELGKQEVYDATERQIRQMGGTREQSQQVGAAAGNFAGVTSGAAAMIPGFGHGAVPTLAHGGVTGGAFDLSTQLAEKLATGKPIDWKETVGAAGFGMVFAGGMKALHTIYHGAVPKEKADAMSAAKSPEEVKAVTDQAIAEQEAQLDRLEPQLQQHAQEQQAARNAPPPPPPGFVPEADAQQVLDNFTAKSPAFGKAMDQQHEQRTLAQENQEADATAFQRKVDSLQPGAVPQSAEEPRPAMLAANRGALTRAVNETVNNPPPPPPGFVPETDSLSPPPAQPSPPAAPVLEQPPGQVERPPAPPPQEPRSKAERFSQEGYAAGWNNTRREVQAKLESKRRVTRADLEPFAGEPWADQVLAGLKPARPSKGPPQTKQDMAALKRALVEKYGPDIADTGNEANKLIAFRDNRPELLLSDDAALQLAQGDDGTFSADDVAQSLKDAGHAEPEKVVGRLIKRGILKAKEAPDAAQEGNRQQDISGEPREVGGGGSPVTPSPQGGDAAPAEVGAAAVAEAPAEVKPATSDTGVFGQTIFRPATGNQQSGLFHEPVKVEAPPTEKIKASGEALNPKNTGEMLHRGASAEGEHRGASARD
jgi:hypothetical protein